MRLGMWVVAAVVGLGLAKPARAQKSIYFGGVDPRDVVYKPIDQNVVYKPGELQNAVIPLQTPPQDKFSFRRLFSKVIPGLSPTPPTNVQPLPPTFPAPATGLPNSAVNTPMQVPAAALPSKGKK